MEIKQRRQLPVLAHPVQKLLTDLTVPPLSSYVACSVPNVPIHVLPPNSGRPPLLLQSNLYALPPIDLSYHPDVRNPQIHSIFEVGESLTHFNPNMQASSFSSGISQQQLKGLRQQIAAIESTLGTTSDTPVSMYSQNPITSFPTLSSSYVSENASPTTLRAIVQSGIPQSFSLINIDGKNLGLWRNKKKHETNEGETGGREGRGHETNTEETRGGWEESKEDGDQEGGPTVIFERKYINRKLKSLNRLVSEHHTWANRNNDESSGGTVGNGGAGDEKAADD
ncbi:kirola-like [Cucumis melo var. makuwa]|uniref:Kirola-like n=1 Tax=Cucumis melo var. makuwa TaxID=1194695 RepID=A0A5A7TDW1_CUCMM|nr:kirola-like [Cucumis melo var. makuwa]